MATHTKASPGRTPGLTQCRSSSLWIAKWQKASLRSMRKISVSISPVSFLIWASSTALFSIVLIFRNDLSTSEILGKMSLSSTFALKFPPLRLRSMTIRRLMELSGLRFRINANFDTVPILPSRSSTSFHVIFLT